MSDLIDNYINQDLIWKSVASLNGYNEPTYVTTTIKGRKTTGFKLITNAKGQEVVSSAYIITKSPIVVNDLIDGCSVISSQSAVSLTGAVSFYEVYTS